MSIQKFSLRSDSRLHRITDWEWNLIKQWRRGKKAVQEKQQPVLIQIRLGGRGRKRMESISQFFEEKFDDRD